MSAPILSLPLRHQVNKATQQLVKLIGTSLLFTFTFVVEPQQMGSSYIHARRNFAGNTKGLNQWWFLQDVVKQLLRIS